MYDIWLVMGLRHIESLAPHNINEVPLSGSHVIKRDDIGPKPIHELITPNPLRHFHLHHETIVHTLRPLMIIRLFSASSRSR